MLKGSILSASASLNHTFPTEAMHDKQLGQRLWPDVHRLTASPVASAFLSCQSLCLSLGVSTAILALSLGQPSATATLLTNWQYDPATNQLELLLPDGTAPKFSLHNQPTRIVVDLPNTEVGTDTTQLYPESPVRSVSLSQYQPGVARIVMDFAPGVVLTPEKVQLQRIGLENRWVLRPIIAEAGNISASSTTPILPFRESASPATPAVPVTTAAPFSNAPPKPTNPNPSPVSAPSGFRPAPNPEPNPTRLQLPNGPIQPVRVDVRVPLNQAPPPSVLARPTVTLPPRPNPSPIPVTVPPPPVVSYGQPLPGQSGYAVPPSNVGPPFQPSIPLPQAAIAPSVLLPAGTRLSLLYPGTEPLPLDPKPSRQDVLLLQGGILDSSGNLVVPPNTPVIGRFETNNNGSRFVAQAIYLNGRSIPLVATSERIGGDGPRPSQRSLLQNSGIGGLALFVLTGFSGIGLLAGAAAGAATTYATAPQPATIQPGQIFQVRLTEDLPQASLF